MLKIYPADARYAVDMGWLKSRLSFSFGAYFDPENTAFGVMRVCNDDEIEGGRGFGPHPHSDMEVVTIVLEGAIKHEDNLGNTVVTKAGGVQRMSAGTGIVHAEYNASEHERLRLLQLWFEPNRRGLSPSFESKDYDPGLLLNAWLPVVAPAGSAQAAAIHQDMTIYLSRLEKNKELQFRQEPGRKAFLFVIEGSARLNGRPLETRDTVRLEGEPELHLAAGREGAFLMLIDLPGELEKTAGKETFLVKHAVGGRSFIDTAKRPFRYRVEKRGEGWKFTVSDVPEDLAGQIMEWKRELNVFLFQDVPGRPVKKIWFYVNEGPVDYDAASGQLTINAQSEIEYVPEEFHFQ